MGENRGFSERRFSDEVLDAVSTETRKSLVAFAQSISHAERLLDGYHKEISSSFTGEITDPLAHIRENARLVFTMTWSKSVLFSRSVVDSVNDGNLLAAFQSLRGYVELIAVVRFTVRQMAPLVRDATNQKTVSSDAARSLAYHMDILLHGGRFNWQAYFEQGAAAIMEKKRLKRTKEEKTEFETNSLRVGKCIVEWGKDAPAAEFIYEYLCDLVHPNKGSNLIILTESQNGPIFDASGKSQMGMIIFERIFPYAASLCMGGMVEFQPFFAMLGANETEGDTASSVDNAVVA